MFRWFHPELLKPKCALRIFCLSQAGDAVDDETLSSRVAALGLLQLSFAHLGLDIEPEESFENNSSFTSPLSIAEQHEVKQGLDHMSKACCSELKKLSDSERLSPRAKLSVLIQTHKLIVEALSVLPTIPMRREVSTADNASITSRPSGAEVEMTDDAKSLGGRSVPPSRVGSPTQQDSKAHERTPRPGSIEKYGSDDNMPNIKLSEPILSPPTGQSGAPKQDRKNITASTSVKKGSSADVILPVLIYAVVQA